MVLAFFLNAVMPSLTLATAAAQIPASTLEEDSPLQELLGGRFLICTPEGVKLVSWAELQNQENEPAADTETGCTLCNLPTFGTTVASISLENGNPIAFPEFETSRYACADSNIHTGVIPSRNFLTRAPPYILT
ncbi:MAG: hypothetical protein MI743_13865 [Sneathiellales bacterium]|nr:hypothetical protein [Sneathiellales bacterium]